LFLRREPRKQIARIELKRSTRVVLPMQCDRRVVVASTRQLVRVRSGHREGQAHRLVHMRQRCPAFDPSMAHPFEAVVNPLGATTACSFGFRLARFAIALPGASRLSCPGGHAAFLVLAAIRK
jgi:hypothetical protein